MTRILTFAAAALAVAASAAAAAASAPLSIGVSYRDLDLSSSEGRQALDKRIAVAARKVCPTVDMHDLRGAMATKACIRIALASAQPQLAAVTARRARVAA